MLEWTSWGTEKDPEVPVGVPVEKQGGYQDVQGGKKLQDAGRKPELGEAGKDTAK